MESSLQRCFRIPRGCCTLPTRWKHDHSCTLLWGVAKIEKELFKIKEAERWQMLFARYLSDGGPGVSIGCFRTYVFLPWTCNKRFAPIFVIEATYWGKQSQNEDDLKQKVKRWVTTMTAERYKTGYTEQSVNINLEKPKLSILVVQSPFHIVRKTCDIFKCPLNYF